MIWRAKRAKADYLRRRAEEEAESAKRALVAAAMFEKGGNCAVLASGN